MKLFSQLCPPRPLRVRPSQREGGFLSLSLLMLVTSLAGFTSAEELPPIKPIERRIPPRGIELPDDTETTLNDSLNKLQARLDNLADHEQYADVAALLKAVRFAIELGEFYKPDDVQKAETLLEEASRRLDVLSRNETPWQTQRGPVVRGFISNVDGSPQPYGVHIPDDLDLTQPQPLIVWLHGRGDKQTDMHFLAERMANKGQVAPPWAIVVHPFGRQCIGFKSAGETDVLEAIEAVGENYKISPNKIILMGFSMGGAGAWHLGAHYADRWAAVSPGAGFAEMARYQRLKPEDYPPLYEQKLWGVYDTPDYVRNLFNTRVVAYSGELDKQIQAARVMEEAYQQEGRELTHLIGPGMGHKYHPDVLEDILERMHEAAKQGRPELPKEVHLQTRTLRYNRMHWIEAQRLDKHWEDSRIDAKLLSDDSVVIKTKNVKQFRIDHPSLTKLDVTIDGQKIGMVGDEFNNNDPMILWKADGNWSGSNTIFEGSHLKIKPPPAWRRFIKQPSLQGPIDDVFRESFLFVLPSGESPNPRVQQWVEFEAAHQQRRWRELFRGEVRSKLNVNVTAEDREQHHLILWGDPTSNRLIRKFVDDSAQPLRWTDSELTVAGKTYDSATHVPAMIYPAPGKQTPDPDKPPRYIVLNSGPTFREAHDRTNSLQNPKLPDWAVLDITSPPTAEAAGKVVAADFFNEKWQ